MEYKGVKITERGWAGHFICANRCSFRRNTLLEYEDRKLIVSTVGAFRNKDNIIDNIGYDRWYETRVFETCCTSNGYIEVDTMKEIDVFSNWGIFGKSWKEVLEVYGNDIDNVANNIHDEVIDEMIEKIKEM